MKRVALLVVMVLNAQASLDVGLHQSLPMVSIKKWTDLQQFAGKVVAFETNIPFLEHAGDELFVYILLKSSSLLLRTRMPLRYAYISERPSLVEIFDEPSRWYNKGYYLCAPLSQQIERLVSDRNLWGTRWPLWSLYFCCCLKEKNNYLRMRLATNQEEREIKNEEIFL